MDRLDVVGQPASHAGHGEDHLEVLRLRGADHVEDPARPEGRHPIAHRGEVGGGVAEALVGLPDAQGQRIAVAVGEPRGEDAGRPAGVLEESGGGQVVHHGLEQWVVGRLPDHIGLGEQDPEVRVDGVEVADGLGDQDPPEPERLGIAGLERHDAGPTAVLEPLVGIELGAGLGVEAVQVADGEPGHGLGLTEVDQVLDQHPEGRPPVADVVAAHHGVAEQSERAAERVTDHRRAQVADVHLLGHVGCGVVHHAHPSLRVRRYAERLVRGHGIELGDERVGGDRDVDEPWSGHLKVGNQASGVDAGDDLLGDLPGIAPQSLRQRHDAIDLVVRTVRPAKHRVGSRLEAIEGRGKALKEPLGQRVHGLIFAPAAGFTVPVRKPLRIRPSSLRPGRARRTRARADRGRRGRRSGTPQGDR